MQQEHRADRAQPSSHGRPAGGGRPPRGDQRPWSTDRGKLCAWAREWASLLAFASIVLFARASLADHYVVPSGSMEPTVEVGDRIFVDKSAFGLRIPLTQVWLGSVETPARGDVVVLAPPQEDGTVLLKRVVAVEGDEVVVRRGRLAIDGHPVAVHGVGVERRELLGVPHRIRLSDGGGPDMGPVRVPPGQMLVMGDNRGNSRDGRTFGFVRVETVLGRAVAVYARGGHLTWQRL